MPTSKRRRLPPRPRPRPPRVPEIRHTPGMADRMMHELAPYLAEDGIDLKTAKLDLAELQQALDRAVARRNHALFTPVGPARELAIIVIRHAVSALIDHRPRLAVMALEEAVPESPDGTAAEVSACIGTALRLLDRFLNPEQPGAPIGLELAPPPPRWPAAEIAPEMLTAARRGQAYDSLHELIVHNGGRGVHYACASALAVVIRAWSRQMETSAHDLIRAYIR